MSTSKRKSDYIMLRDAIKKKNKQKAYNILRRAVDVNTSNARDHTLLHWAIIKFDDVDILKILLDRGANINAINHNHDKPLEFAIKSNKTKATVLLIKKGALIKENLRPLILLAIENNNHVIVKYLIDYGMQYNASLDLLIVFTVAISRGEPKILKSILPHCRFPKPSDKYIRRELVIKSDQKYNECVKLLLQWNFTINPSSYQDEDFIYGAVENGHLPIVLQLLNSGIDVGLKSSKTGLSLLKAACLKKHHEIVENLLKHNACVNQTTPTNIKILNDPTSYYCNAWLLFTYDKNNLHDVTCLHIAVLNSDPITTKLLLQYGAKIMDDPKFFNIIRIAIRNNCEEIVRIFLDQGVDVNDTDHQGQSLLDFCVNDCALNHDNKYNIVKILLEKGAADQIQTQGSSLFFEAINKGYHKVARLFLDYKPNIQYVGLDGDTPLHKAIEEDFDAKFIENLLKLNAPVEIKNNNMHTPLFIACKNKLKNQLDIIEILIQFKANINSTDKNLTTPLHVACQDQNLEVVTVLLKNGANPNATNEKGQTPLHFICSQNNIESESTNEITLNIIHLLLQYNANIEAVDVDGWTPLFKACSSNNYVVIECLLENNAVVNHSDLKNQTPIFIAAQNAEYNSNIIELLLKHNIKFHPIGNTSESVINIIVGKNDIKLIKRLALMQVDFNSVNDEGDTPLHTAVQEGYLDMIKLLLKNGANVDILNEKNQTPLQIAVNYLFDHKHKVEELLRRRLCYWSPEYLNRWQNFNENDYDTYFHVDDIRKYQEIIKILKIQISKLKTAKIEVTNQNLMIYNNNDVVINKSNLEDDCELEIQEMKMESIGVNKITFYDLLKNDLHFIRRFVHIKRIQKTLKLKSYNEKFPLYIDMIRGQFRNAKLFQKFINSARAYFREYVYHRLNDECLEIVFGYLSMKEMKMFIEAIKPSQR